MTQVRVLLIEADTKTGHEIGLILNPDRFVLHHTDLGEEGLDLAIRYGYDIIVLERDLPDMNGHEVLRTLRKEGVKTPVIVVSKPCDVEEKVTSLNLGADDHVIKPVYREEMIGRINAIFRRSLGFADSTVKIDYLSLNIDTKSVFVGGSEIHLTKKQYLLLETLCLHRGVVLSREVLLSHLYKDETVAATDQSINVVVGRIRKKLGLTSTGDDYIETVRGFGYVLKVPETTK